MSLLLSFKLFQKLEEDLGEVGPEDLENTAPNAPLTSADHVVGTMSEPLRHLFAVLQGKQREFARMFRQHELDVHLTNIPDAEKRRACEHAQKELGPRLQYVEFIKEIFWVSLRAEHPELNVHPGIGVREGWRVVWIDEEKQLKERLSPLIQKLFGESMPGAFPFHNVQLLEEEDDDPDSPVGQAC